MKPTTDLHAIPVAERLEMINLLWESLVEDAQPAQLVPAWHADFLAERKRAFEDGTETFCDLDESLRQHPATAGPRLSVLACASG